jgi:ABC-2 type transport system ATP-binding protein
MDRERLQQLVPGPGAQRATESDQDHLGPDAHRTRTGRAYERAGNHDQRPPRLCDTEPMAEPETALAARGLIKQFRRIRAVDGIDLTVGAGERVALLGPNGAGKTTTLMMLLGVITPDEGEIEIVGRTLPGERSAAMEQVGFAAGYLPLPERLRVREFLELFADLYGLRDGRAAVARGLERFRIEGLADIMGNELSSGQRTLVGIVKAGLHQPKLLVLDEPTASLDPDVAHRVRSGLERLCAEDGTALLVTSHNMQEVERLCSRVVFVAGGRVVADGTPEAVAARFGRADLEGVFLHLAESSAETIADARVVP